MIRTLSLAAALLLAVPACAQRHETSERTHIVQENNGHRLEVRMRGDVDFNDDGNWVQRVSPGGSLMVEERSRGTTRRVDFTPGEGGRVDVRYQVDGRARQMDARGREWASVAILQAVRGSGLGARERVAHLRQRGGVPAVLNEVGQMRGDGARRAYYQALLTGQPLSPADMSRVMADVDRRMSSDSERRIVLVHALEHARGEGAMRAILEAAGGMDSDMETRIVLSHALDQGRLPAGAQQAFFHAVDGMGSDMERRIVLTRWLERGGAADAAFFRAVDGIDSDMERRIVLTQALRGGSSEASTVAALHSAARMSSDMEKRIVLSQVPAAQLRNGRVTAAYRAVVDRMRSDHERSIALQRLARGS
ncbi:hypothetical protein [Longimicrobium sp.]|uniref:hypothetical protein n=1 Tax=Longimicrobium sp. TaxID=2029185 RepID=UPI002F9365C4